jgi:hypothetical protein
MTQIACLLTEAELRERRAAVRHALQTATVEQRMELPDGYLFRFAPEPGLIERLATFVELERACCPFLTFAIEVSDNQGPVALRLTGPEGTKEFLSGTLAAG